MSDCHCERCRQFTGHYMAATSAELDDIDIQDPDSLLRWFFPVPEAGYGFCSALWILTLLAVDSEPRPAVHLRGNPETPTGLKTSGPSGSVEASDYHDRPDLPELATE